ncbi:MAG: serine/threonine-protein kinase [Kofleriaceae bacterium]
MRYGDYDVVAPLASGGMGGVYLATHRTTGDRVALKVLASQFANSDDVVERLYAERAVSAKASHPGLIDIRAAGRSSDDVPFLVMEYLEGETLATILGRGALEMEAIVTLCAQIAAALAALHEAGVVHCDVKPENLFVQSNGAVKVIDFGVSRGVNDEPLDSIAGTPAYMAPEQWKGTPALASDVYSLGCVMYELVTGDVPFDGSLPELMNAHMERRPARVSWLRSAVPVEIERLITRALSKAPGLRPTMLEMARSLGRLVAHTMPLRLAG